jgi:hypothetical protein
MLSGVRGRFTDFDGRVQIARREDSGVESDRADSIRQLASGQPPDEDFLQ